MEASEKARVDQLYQHHLRALKLRGMSDSTIDVYARAVRRVTEYYDACPDQLTTEQLEVYFAALVESHSWSTVKVDRIGLQFYWQHVLKRDWRWVEIIKVPQVRTLPDILTVAQIEQLMGLRLSETLALQVGDIDGPRQQVHIRRGKGHKDRMVPLPDLTYQALRALWCKHRHPTLLFPNALGSLERIRSATTPMDRGGAQAAMKAVVAQCGIKKKYRFTRCVTASPRTCSNRV